MRTFAVSLLLSLLIAMPALAGDLQSDVERIIRSTNLGKARLGILIRDLSSGDDVAVLRTEEQFIPASNMKIITTAAALKRLGPEHIMSTELRMDGDKLFVVGNGDPAFLDPVLLEECGLSVENVIDRWVEAVRATGRTRFSEIIADDRAFDREYVHPDWPRNQLQKWYCAQVAGINFNDNCFDIYVRPTAPGEPLAIRIEPQGTPFTLENSARTGRGKLAITRRIGSNRIVVSGRSRDASSSPNPVTIHDPPMAFVGLLRDRLRRSGIHVGPARRVREGEMTNGGGNLIAVVNSTLPSILLRTNRDSQNLFAEALVKHMARLESGRPGAWREGVRVLESFLSESVGVQADDVVIADGSGLSRANRVTPTVLVNVLHRMHVDDELGIIYRNSFARPGRRGTMRKRFQDAELTGALYGKSGYLNGTYTLSGYLVIGDRTLAFSMLLNDYANGGAEAKQMMEKILIAVDQHFARLNEPAFGG